MGNNKGSGISGYDSLSGRPFSEMTSAMLEQVSKTYHRSRVDPIDTHNADVWGRDQKFFREYTDPNTLKSGFGYIYDYQLQYAKPYYSGESDGRPRFTANL